MINKYTTFGILLTILFSFVVAYAEYPSWGKIFLNDHVQVKDKIATNTDTKSTELIEVSDSTNIRIHHH